MFILNENKIKKGLYDSETHEIYNEGFGSWLKNLSTGKIEERVDELEKEIKSGVNTPEEQKILLSRVNKELDYAITLKYNKKPFKEFVFSVGDFFNKIFKNDKDNESFNELNSKLTSVIKRLSTARDSLLNLKFEKDPEVAKKIHEELKEKAKEIVEKASKRSLDKDDF